MILIRGSMDKKEPVPWVQLLFFFFLGLGFSILWAAILDSDLTGYWVALDPPPEAVSELIAIGGLSGQIDNLIVSDKDGNQFECITPRAGCYEWQPISVEMKALRQAEKYPCNFQHPRFTFFARPFQKVEQCLEILFDAGGYGTNRYVFVLDDQGYLWEGIYGGHDDDIYFGWFLFLLPISLLVSFSIGLVWYFLSSRIGKRRKKKE